MKKSFPDTIFSVFPSEGYNEGDLASKQALFRCIKKYSKEYTRKQRNFIEEVFSFIFFHKKRDLSEIGWNHLIEIAWSEYIRELYKYKENPSKQIMEMFARDVKVHQNFSTALEVLGMDEKTVEDTLKLPVDFFKKELMHFLQIPENASYIIQNYTNYIDVAKGYRLIHSLEGSLQHHPAIDLLRVEEQKESSPQSPYREWLEKWKDPTKVKEYLDEYIVGQTTAKISASMAVFAYIQHLDSPEEVEDVSHCLFYGPSGSGKSYLWKKISEILPMEFVEVDSSLYSPTGFQGGELSDLMQNISGKKSLVVLFDEFDKLLRIDQHSRNASNCEGDTQASFLKMIDTGRIHVGRKVVDVRNYLFIFCGAFSEITNNKADRKSIGFLHNNETMSINKSVSEEDFYEKYHFLPELMGRLAFKAQLEALGYEDYVRICKLPTGPLRSVMMLYRKLGLELVICEDTYREIALLCLESQTGTRNIKRILMEIAKEKAFFAFYESKKEIRIVAEDIKKYAKKCR